MNDATSNTSESSLLLWMLAAMVGMLATYVSLGWVREGQRKPALRDSWRVVLLAASVTLATLSWHLMEKKWIQSDR